MARHNWNKEDHIIAYYLYKYGMESLGDTIKLLKLLDISLSSMTMIFANLISSIYGEEVGKFKYSDMDKEVVKEYKQKSQKDFRKEIFDILYEKVK
jgi:hypothetical protein